MFRRFSLSLYASLLFYGSLYAEDQANSQELGTIQVTGNVDSQSVAEQKVGETKTTAQTIKKQQITDSRDLVRYQTGITAVETGRFGASGYAVRGVDENRVAITVDGLRQAETLSSQGFKDLFEGYGNFNNTRNGVEMENVKTANITKGADSIKAGSGALGGSVMFETKDARDFLTEKNYHFGFKQGYQSVDSQNFHSFTGAARYGWFDFLVINTDRHGHERKNYFYDIYDSKEDKLHIGKTREKADPYTITKKSTLVKVGFQPGDENRFSVAIDDSKQNSDGEDLSYTLRMGSYPGAPERYGRRTNHDSSTRKNVQFAYENFSETPFWDHVKISYSKQSIKNRAINREGCQGNECMNIQNPSGMHLDSSSGTYNLLDKNNRPIGVDPNTGTIQDGSGNNLTLNTDYKTRDGVYLDCSKFDCTKKLKVLKETYDSDTWDYNYQMVEREIETHTLADGRVYGTIKKDSSDEDIGTKSHTLYFVTPGKRGYEEIQYSDRTLDTDTQQLNLDFEKDISLFDVIDNSISYGGLLDRTDKSMTNKDGFYAGNSQWWDQIFFGRTPGAGTPNPDYHMNGQLRNNTTSVSTYLIPVQTTTMASYIGDEIQITKYVGFDLGYRYDTVKHKPKYTGYPEIPRGIITGLWVPYPYNPYDGIHGYYTPYGEENYQQNLKFLLREKEYKSGSYKLGLNLDPLDWMRIQLKGSKGFRAPTSDEAYMTFKHPDFSIRPNIDLEAEIARTKEIALTFYIERSRITFDVFKTDYKNFIDLEFLGNLQVVDQQIPYPFYQNVNRDSAKVHGFEINTHLELGDVSESMEGFRLGYKYSRQKGRMSCASNGSNANNSNSGCSRGEEVPMNAIQPPTSVYNIGYSTPGDKYGIDLFITDVGAKKRKDTYNMYWKSQIERDDPIWGHIDASIVNGEPVTDNTKGWRSSNYTVVDVIAYAKPQKNFNFGLGVYNLTNAKYITWDSARSIRAFGTVNMIDQATGAGIGRFYAPRRNFRFNWEITF
ncbi:TonB-dependent hemoglobin/transferrin/lactoferrin family receptor [uncultured Campylobacter sp.]|uniref:TonB-dependent hemoglobin/transferrin/lactoferrin family receptor n=1 Tax=uncultured Campylobacter sp. TaxID=218934 RepID=UPI00261F1E53|nr:TonB-dependent hemoglobin/transferrin/lactoferrin family receptor [uncultured Campylobacter sp.]